MARTSENPQLTLHPEDGAAREAQAARVRLRLRLALAILASALALVAIGSWTYYSVERSLHEVRATTLKSLLDAQAKTLEVWIEDQKLRVKRLARDRQVLAHMRALVAIAQRADAIPEQYCVAPARRPLVEQLDEALAGSGAVAFDLIGRSGRIIASRFPEYCGLQVRSVPFARALEPVFEGETRFIRPHGNAELLDQPPAALPLARPLVWVETPVFGAEGEVIAALGVGEYAHEQFAAILAAGRSGTTGEVYAFDRAGSILSETRFPATDAASHLAASAQSGVAAGTYEGLLLVPYVAYHGGGSIGAWRWLPEHDMGIAVEIGADEAYAPLVVLRTALGVVFGALVAAVIAALAAWFSAAKLRSESGRQRLGPYVLGERIGTGGAANIYLARHDLLKRPTAVKLLKASRATDEMVARFEREAQLASQLSHPNTVEIFDFGRAPGGLFYYAMEYLEGATVGDVVLRVGALPLARALHLLRQVCAGLAEAHGKGLVHRDVSPSNIMVCRHGGLYDFVKILDFGLVKNVASPQSQDITRTLRILGTVLYMAPERLRDPADVDPRADIYAVGAVAFLMLTGRRMFGDVDEISLTSLVLNEPAPRLSSAAAQPIPEALERLVAACLEKRRDDRPQDIGALLQVLDPLAHAAPWTQQDAEAAWQASRRYV